MRTTGNACFERIHSNVSYITSHWCVTVVCVVVGEVIVAGGGGAVAAVTVIDT